MWVGAYPTRNLRSAFSMVWRSTRSSLRRKGVVCTSLIPKGLGFWVAPAVEDASVVDEAAVAGVAGVIGIGEAERGGDRGHCILELAESMDERLKAGETVLLRCRCRSRIGLGRSSEGGWAQVLERTRCFMAATGAEVNVGRQGVLAAVLTDEARDGTGDTSGDVNAEAQGEGAMEEGSWYSRLTTRRVT